MVPADRGYREEANMDNGIEIAGSDVILLLSRIAPGEARDLLVGCQLDDDSGDQPARIIELDGDRAAVVVTGGRRVPMARIRDAVIIDTRPDAPLRRAILASRTPEEQQEREERLALGRAGIDPGKLASPADRRAVLALVRSAEAGTLPTYQARHAAYLALSTARDAKLVRVGARLFATLIDSFGAVGKVPDDLHWRRAWFLRTAGQLREAVAASDLLHTGALIDPGDRKVLARVRAGALLDLFDVDGDAKWVSLAEKAAAEDLAATRRDEEAWNIYHRLQAARSRLGRNP
jgi:hypothetical protein